VASRVATAGGRHVGWSALVAVVLFAGLWLLPAESEAAKCRADGKRCRTNRQCCGQVCINTAPPGKKPSGRCCTTTTCASAGAGCGLIADGSCPDVLYCGTCNAPEVCGGAGTPNVCAPPATSTTIATTSSTSTTLVPDGAGPTLDPKADLVSLFAFRGYEVGPAPDVTMILTVEPLLEPARGHGSHLFDPEIVYAINIDNDNDALADVTFEFRFTTEVRLPDHFAALLGVGAGGALAPANSPPPIDPGTPVVPPRIATLDAPGVGLRQSYRVTVIRDGIVTDLSAGQTPFALPPDVGPRTMDYGALFDAAVHALGANTRVFAGAVDDPSWVDRGGALDTFNTSKAPPVLSPAEDAALVNLASDGSSGFDANAIAISVPVTLLTRTASIEPPSSVAAAIGVWATTARPRTKSLPNEPGGLPVLSADVVQVGRIGNPLVEELLLGTGARRTFGMEQPVNDGRFLGFFQDPTLARMLNALFGGAMAIPSPPRTDLLPLLTYAPPIAAVGTPPGPVADLLRLNTGVAPTLPGSMNRLGLLGGDAAGFPNGCRVVDDAFDVMLRLVAGGVLAGGSFGTSPINSRLGDGVNVNDVAFRTTFPYLASAHGARGRRHIDPGEPLCTGGGGGPCLP
jgi:hypothetical protein